MSREGRESVSESTQLDEPVDGKAWTGHDANRTGVRKSHPLRDQRLAAVVWLADDQVAHTCVFGDTNNKYGLADQWMKGISDRDDCLRRQIPSIMSAFPRMAEPIIARKAILGA